MSDNSQKQSFLDNMFSYTTRVDNYWYSQEFKIAGLKIKHRIPPKEYINSEICTSDNNKLYADLCNYTKKFKKITLFIDHSYGGGCDKYFWNQVRKLDKTEVIVRLQYIIDYNCYRITLNGACRNFSIFDKDIENVFNQVTKFGLDRIILSNIVGYPSIDRIFKALADYKKSKSYSKILYCLHDYYCICPDYVLLKDGYLRCKGHCKRKEFNKCFECSIDSRLATDDIKNHIPLVKWREKWLNLFTNTVDEIICFSNSSKIILEDIYPSIKNKIVVKPHEFLPFKHSIHIGIIGEIFRHKGSSIIDAIIDYAEHNNIWDISIYVIGSYYGNRSDSKLIKILGEYDRTELPSILKQHQIDMIFIPSVWDETFCYTAQEAIMTDLPVLCFGFGGQAEQVSQYSNGVILEDMNPEIIYSTIKQIYNNNNMEKLNVKSFREV